MTLLAAYKMSENYFRMQTSRGDSGNWVAIGNVYSEFDTLVFKNLALLPIWSLFPESTLVSIPCLWRGMTCPTVLGLSWPQKTCHSQTPSDRYSRYFHFDVRSGDGSPFYLGPHREHER